MSKRISQVPRLMRGGLSGRVYAVTKYLDLGNGSVEALEKYDVHDDFLAMIEEIKTPIGSWKEDS